MLLSPHSFRMKVNGSFYPPSSSGVGTFPTRPDKPLPRRTLRSNGSARPVTGDQKTPFAVVIFFQPEQELDVVQPTTKSDLLAMIEKATATNLFSAVRVDGLFD